MLLVMNEASAGLQVSRLTPV